MGVTLSRCFQWCVGRGRPSGTSGRQSSRSNLLGPSSSCRSASTSSTSVAVSRLSSGQRFDPNTASSSSSSSNIQSRRRLLHVGRIGSFDRRRSATATASLYSSNGDPMTNFGHHQTASFSHPPTPHSPGKAPSSPRTYSSSSVGTVDGGKMLSAGSQFGRSIGQGPSQGVGNIAQRQGPSQGPSQTPCESRRAKWVSFGGGVSTNDAITFSFSSTGNRTPSSVTAPSRPSFNAGRCQDDGRVTNDGSVPSSLRRTLSQRMSAASGVAAGGAPSKGSSNSPGCGYSGNLASPGTRRVRLHSRRRDF